MRATVARACAAAGVFLLAIVGVLVGAPSANATPCATKVLSDWYDNGRIDGLYALPCYQEAIDHIPSELRDYVDAEEVIQRALDRANHDQGVRVRRRARQPTSAHYEPRVTTAQAAAITTIAPAVPRRTVTSARYTGRWRKVP